MSFELSELEGSEVGDESSVGTDELVGAIKSQAFKRMALADKTAIARYLIGFIGKPSFCDKKTSCELIVS